MVDNDESVRAALAGVLGSAGFNVVALPSVYQFIGKGAVDDHACILVDIEVPGLEFLNRHLSSSRKRPLIVLSASDKRSMRRKARELGAVSFFSKPVDDRALIDAIVRATESAS